MQRQQQDHVERLNDQDAQKWLREQRRFMSDRGMSRAGYITYYEQFGTPVEQIKEIWEADNAHLQKLEARVKRSTSWKK